MRHTHPTLLLLATLCACSAGTPDPTSMAVVADPVVARMDSFMQRSVRAGFSGSLLVLRDGRPLIDKGYGTRDREKGLPNTPATVHAIGSITKQFTAACVLKLQEMGKLDVQDLMSKYITSVPADKATITLHHLLTHSAGFPGAIGDDNEPIDGGAFTTLALATPLEFAPGAGYAYSNVGYSLLGIIVEKVGGMSYERYLHDRLLVPAGVLRTGYRLPDWTKEELAIGYRKDGTRWGTMLDHPTVNGAPGWHLRANGGLLSTTHDMADWVEALRTHAVLDSGSVVQLVTPHVLEGEGADSHYGYGWAIFNTPRGTRLITHNGGNGIQFADLLWYADEDVIVVLMSNAAVRGMQDIAWEVGRMVFNADYEPQVVEAPRTLSGLPEGAAGERLKALLTIIVTDGEDAALTTWLEQNLGPGFLEDWDMKDHVTVFKRMRTDIGKHQIERLEQLGPDEYALHLRSDRDKKLYRVMVQLRPSDALIGGLGVESE